MKKIIRMFTMTIVVGLLTACVITETKKETVKPLLENNIFKVDMPAKFDGLYTTTVKDNSINFYDNECMKAGNPGWVFGLYAYQKPSEWAGGPIEKVGELTLSDGTLYDVVIVYPTESQFGFDKPMPDNYKNFYAARYEIASDVKGLNDEKVAIGAGTKGEGLYKNELNKHLKALNEKWDASKLEDENMSPMYFTMGDDSRSILDSVGYAYKDINLDGIEELLIGEVTDGEWKDVIYDIYTMVDRKPQHVISGWDRNRYIALEGGMISNEYSGGANESGVDIYALTTNSTELFPQLSFKYDGYANADKPWFIAYNKKGDDWNYENVDESKYNELVNRFSKHASYTFVPFSTLK